MASRPRPRAVNMQPKQTADAFNSDLASPTPYTMSGTRPTTRTRILQARRFLRSHWRVILLLVAALILESIYHTRDTLPLLPKPLDQPFATTCQVLPVSEPRANATFLMLARNSDRNGALSAVRSIEARFNHWAHYPIVFLNDVPFDDEFVTTLTQATSGTATFTTIPKEMWSLPPWIDQTAAQKAMDAQERDGILYAGKASYHHMCRFNSGLFYDVPSLQKYRWYWRLEPDVSYTCDITYDPFVQMERTKKKYGYIIALWERGKTVPSLYRKISDYKRRKNISTTRLWSVLLARSPIPWPFRKLLSLLRNRDANGDIWNVCHFWSNFEIADMDWLRSPAYREFFEFLDRDGGFYYERWGDAPVHSLAAALLLDDSEVHHFRDWGYIHPPFQYIPIVPKDGGRVLEDLVGRTPEDWQRQNVLGGCNCDIDPSIAVISPTCLNTVSRAFW